MNRLVSLVMLVAFVVQHFVCCCTGAASHSCDHDHSLTEPVCAIEHSHDVHDSHECDQEPLPPSDTDHSDHEGCPCDHQHPHHCCIGTHVFFVSAPRAELPASVLHHDFGFGSWDDSVRGWMTSLATASRNGVDSGPPLSSCPPRSALCVYRV